MEIEEAVKQVYPEDAELKEYRPNKAEILRENEICIRFHSIGCVINVGCKSIPFTNVEEAMKALNSYVENPYEEKTKWYKIFESK
jgi:hypothetical protein